MIIMHIITAIVVIAVLFVTFCIAVRHWDI